MSYLTQKERDDFTFRAITWTALFGALAIYLLLLVGCSSGMVKAREVSVQTIVWERFDPLTCNGEAGKSGCAYINENPCRIVMREDSPDWLVAHEFRHCFGYAHGN